MLGANQIYFIPQTLPMLPSHWSFWVLPQCLCTCSFYWLEYCSLLSLPCYIPGPLALSPCSTPSGKPSVAPHSLGIMYPPCLLTYSFMGQDCKEETVSPRPSRASSVCRQKLLLLLPLEEGSLFTCAGDTLELSTEPGALGCTVVMRPLSASKSSLLGQI